MKILHLIPSLGPGGAERQLSILVSALSEQGIDCHIGYCSNGPNLKEIPADTVSLHQFPLKNNHDPRLLLHIIKLIRTIKPDLVQTWLLQMDVMGGIAAVLTQTPFILSERSSALCYSNSWKFKLRKKIGELASAIVANSQGGLEYWQQQGCKTPLYLIRNAIVPLNCSIDSKVSFPENSRLIVYAGRLSPEKNVILLLKALIEVLGRTENTIVKLFGEGPLKSQLLEIIALEKMADKIFLEGYTQDLSLYLQRAELCILLSDYEGNPNIVLEAAAEGCPLVLSDISAHREIFDDSQVCFVEHKSLENVVSGIQHALDNRVLSQNKAVRAKAVFKEYELDKIVQQYLDVYHKVVG